MPPSAASNRPGLAAIAPVNAPFSWPNSSLSSSVSVSAAQLSAHERAGARGERLVDALGEHLLADAGLAEDEHARSGPSRRARPARTALHRGVARRCGWRAARRRHRARGRVLRVAAAPPLEPDADRIEQLGAREGLREVVVRAERHAAAHVSALGTRRQKDERYHCGRRLRAEDLEHLVAVDAGHADVADHQVGQLLHRELDAALAVARADALEALGFEQVEDVAAHHVVILDHQDPVHASLLAHGMRTVNDVPTPTRCAR